MMMLEKMYKIQTRSTSKKNLARKKPIYYQDAILDTSFPQNFYYGASDGEQAKESLKPQS
jgi:hypothetical protein